MRYIEESAEELDLVTPYSDKEVVPYAERHALLASLNMHLSSLEGRMTPIEDVISQLVPVQNRQMQFFETVQQNLADLTTSVVSLNLATWRDDIMSSVREVLRQKVVSQLCDRHPGPSPNRAGKCYFVFDHPLPCYDERQQTCVRVVSIGTL